MAKLVFIGAGSWNFTRKIVTDVLTYDNFADAEICLVDIHEGRLDMARQACEKVVDALGSKATVRTSSERREVLADADAVMVTILCGSTEIWQHDILIPQKYGVDINVGDTRGPAGIFRALRTIPEMIAIARDMEALCPQAIMLNYTNPMAMLCHAMQRETSVNATGLCHSVQGTANMLANWAGVPPAEVDYVCAGLNHMAWYLRFEHQGRDLYPVLREKVANDPEIYNAEQVRNEMFLALGYYVTESSGHNSEYNWWFRKRPELIERYCTHGTNWNPGHHAYILHKYRERETSWQQEFREWIESPDWDDPEKRQHKLGRSHEYASEILNAYVGGEMFRFNGNVPNHGAIGNLPDEACVEVPVLASRGRLQTIQVGDLPASVLPLVSLSAQLEMMAVDACIRGDARLVFQAVCQDPLTASVLSLAEIREMTAELFAASREYLPTFSDFDLGPCYSGPRAPLQPAKA